MKTRFIGAMGIVLLPCGLAAPTVVAADESPRRTAATPVELEAEIRSELDSLRERIEDLEVLLATLVASRGAAVPSADAEPSLALAAADAGVSAGSDLPAPAAQDADPGMPEGVASTGGQALSITGLVDTYYTHNANDPEDGNNTLYYTNPNARGFGLNQLKLEIETAGDGPFGFRSDIWFGSGARLFRDGLEPGPLADLLYVQQAYGYYRFGNGAQFDMGAFGTIAGLEVAESHLNWNYTRGILWAWNEPFSHVGARLGVPLSDTFTGTLMLVNGFDNAWDQNTGKSYGVQGSLAPGDQFNTTLTWINGPENAGTNRRVAAGSELERLCRSHGQSGGHGEHGLHLGDGRDGYERDLVGSRRVPPLPRQRPGTDRRALRVHERPRGALHRGRADAHGKHPDAGVPAGGGRRALPGPSRIPAGLVGCRVLQLLRLRRGTLEEPEHLHHRDVLGLRAEVSGTRPTRQRSDCPGRWRR